MKSGIESFVRDKGSTTSIAIGLVGLSMGFSDLWGFLQFAGLLILTGYLFYEGNKHVRLTGNYPKLQDIKREIIMVLKNGKKDKVTESEGESGTVEDTAPAIDGDGAGDSEDPKHW